MSSQDRLLVLKSKLPNTLTVVPEIKPKALKNGVIRNFTLLLGIVIIFTSFSQKIVLVQRQILDRSDSWMVEIKRILDTDGSNQNQILDRIVTEFEREVLPITNFWGIKSITHHDLQKLKNLAQDWLWAIAPFSQYRLSADGLVSKSGDKYFTDDLKVFLDKLPALYRSTQNLIRSFWYYRSLAITNSKLSRTFQLIDELLQVLDFLVKNGEQILEILGHNSTKRMVIFNQNVGEARPTGGFYGSFVPLDITKGRLKIGQSLSIYNVDDNKPELLAGHPISWYYGYFFNRQTEQGIRNLNYFTCFSDSARLLESEFSRSKAGYSIEQMVMITPNFIQNILPADFTLDVPGVGPLNGANFLQEVERQTSLEAEDKSNLKSSLSPILQAFLAKLPEVVAQQGYLTFIQNIWTSFQSRDIQLWAKLGSSQDLFRKLGLTGEQTCQNQSSKNIIAPILVNLSGDKRNLLTSNQYNMWVEKTWMGPKVTIKWKQIIPPNPILQRGYNKFTPMSFVGVQVPSQAFDFEVTSPQGLRIPFLRQYYQQRVAEDTGREPKISEVLRPVVNSAYDLNPSASGFGSVYTQMDGSRVVGAYIQDEEVSEVEISFVLPVDQYQPIWFYIQPGLHQPSLGLGGGVKVVSPRTFDSLITDRLTLQSGVVLTISQF